MKRFLDNEHTLEDLLASERLKDIADRGSRMRGGDGSLVGRWGSPEEGRMKRGNTRLEAIEGLIHDASSLSAIQRPERVIGRMGEELEFLLNECASLSEALWSTLRENAILKGDGWSKDSLQVSFDRALELGRRKIRRGE